MRDCTNAVPFRLLFSLASCPLHACFRSTNHLKYHESFFLVQKPLLLLIISQPVYRIHHRTKLRHQVHRLHSSSSFYLYSPSQNSSFFLPLSHLELQLQCNEFASSGAGRSLEDQTKAVICGKREWKDEKI